jgi:hypothetical protein
VPRLLRVDPSDDRELAPLPPDVGRVLVDEVGDVRPEGAPVVAGLVVVAGLEVVVAPGRELVPLVAGRVVAVLDGRAVLPPLVGRDVGADAGRALVPVRLADGVVRGVGRDALLDDGLDVLDVASKASKNSSISRKSIGVLARIVGEDGSSGTLSPRGGKTSVRLRTNDRY